MKKACLLWALLVPMGLAKTTFAGWPAAPPPAPLPKLAQPLVLDGDPSEWAGAGCACMRYEEWIGKIQPPHKWRGPADAGMEVYYAWNDEGLCLAAVVADDDVRISSDGKLLGERDCVRFHVDGRLNQEFMMSRYTAGAYSLVVRPPTETTPVTVAVEQPAKARAEGIKVAGRRTPAGYTVELLVPWSAFPGLVPKPAAELALKFHLSDSDSPDGETNQPLTMSFQVARDILGGLPRAIRCALSDRPRTDPMAQLEPMVQVNVISVSSTTEPLPITVEVGALLAQRVGSFHISATDSCGNPVMNTTVKAAPLPAPWNWSVGARYDWTPDANSEGNYKITIIPTDLDGNPLGTVIRRALFPGHFVEKAIASLRDANLPALSQTDPCKAAAYLGVASCVERFKFFVERQNTSDAGCTLRETQARLDLLDDGRLEPKNRGLLDLLALAANPEAQVVVEFTGHGSDSAQVMFHWGSVLIALADVQEHASDRDAKSALEQRVDGLWADSYDATTVDGLPGRIRHRRFDSERLATSDFDPGREVLLLYQKDAARYACAVNVNHIAHTQVNAAVILPDCPEPVRQAVKRWAKKARVPILPFGKATGKERLLVAGNVRSGEVAAAIGATQIMAMCLVEGITELQVADGNRLITVITPDEQVARQVVRLVVARNPVKPEDVEAIRQQLTKSVTPDTVAAPLPEGMAMFCGDLHTHTCYSDGLPSPTGLVLQAMHCFLDFTAVTDHYTIEGAKLARKLVGQYGIDFPVIVGEEITTGSWHMNAYPLGEAISSKLSPYDTIKTAHSQGAAVQWNHPGWPASEWALTHMRSPFQESGLDAWEHIPASYDERKQNGTLPVIVGTTDTHDGLFGRGERTIVVAPTAQGDDVAEAIRAGRIVAVSAGDGRLFYGQNKMIASVCGALPQAKAIKAERLRSALRNADVAGLLEASQPKRMEMAN